MKTLIAIDPGASGGIAIAHNGHVEAYPMPDDAALLETLAPMSRESTTVCYMELVGGFIKGNPAPGSAMFNFGNSYGYIRGLLAALRIKLVLVRPQMWQKGIPGMNQEKAARKRALKEHAARLFPNLKVTLSTADALCILNYANNEEARKPDAITYTKIKVATVGNPNGAKFGADFSQGGPIPKGKQAVEVDQIETLVIPPSKTKTIVAKAAPVVLPESVKEQAELAIAWCKKNGWPVPPRKSAAFSSMFDYWYNKAINGEA